MTLVTMAARDHIEKKFDGGECLPHYVFAGTDDFALFFEVWDL